MIFWDSSAIVPLVVEEPASADMAAVLAGDDGVIVWWATPTECASAIARREAEGVLAAAAADAARRRIDLLAGVWNEVLASDQVRERAGRLLRTHRLRSADALQLAAALTWARGRARGHLLCTLDDRLGNAARKEGFELASPTTIPGGRS